MLRLALKTLTTLLITALAALLLAAVLIPKMLGLVPLAIVSGSMAPTHPTGTLVIMKPVTPAEAQALELGTVVTFQARAGGPFITHRLIGKTEGASGIRLITQGDANSTPDEAVEPAQVQAQLSYAIPYAGLGAALAPQGLKTVAAPAAAGALLLAAVCGALAFRRSKRTE